MSSPGRPLAETDLVLLTTVRVDIGISEMSVSVAFVFVACLLSSVYCEFSRYAHLILYEN